MNGSEEFREGVPFVGGNLWIDLLNTTPVIEGHAQDLIGGTGPLQNWARLARLAQDPPSSQDVGGAQTLRESLRAAFEQLAAGQPLSAPLVVVVNEALNGVTVTRQLADVGGAVRLIEQERRVVGAVQAAVALDFARFVTDFTPDRLKHCQNPACTMVFYDRGKNGRRRWCSTSVCGNRDKVANYRARKALLSQAKA